jgi:hypothetical protein
VQNGFDRGLIGQAAGRIQQNVISICGARHMLSYDLWKGRQTDSAAPECLQEQCTFASQLSTNSVPAAIAT